MAKEEEKMPMIGAVRECTTRSLLDNMFEKFNVVEMQAKMDALKEAMYNPEVFFSCGEEDINRQYETLVGAFLSGIWKEAKR
ncbi:MAG: hypothetical protein LBK66_15160 [Spirochaetaceae bacterium]|jgi:hypothetical protein|nr:hypothetical protein [Spirochaetaceae bacterium]